MRRAHLKRMSQRSYHLPEKYTLREYSLRAQSTEAIPATLLDMEQWEGMPEPKGFVPSGKTGRGKDAAALVPVRDNVPPLVRVIQRIWQGKERQQGVNHFRFLYLVKGPFVCVRLFFSGNEAFLLEENFVDEKMRRSVLYKGTDRAKHAYHHGSVTWVDLPGLKPLPPPT